MTHGLRSPSVVRRARTLRSFTLVAVLSSASVVARAQTDSTARKSNDPRVGLGGGWMDAKEAASNLQLTAHRDRPEGFVNPKTPGDFGFINADLAFRGTDLFLGGFNGFQVWDIADASNPKLRSTFVCPGGQGDLSVYKNLLFMSVEETRGRVDCGTKGVADSVSAERFRGVRVFDIADLEHPKQVAAVQTCRGSHTHTLVVDPKDAKNVYIYVSGTSVVRSGAELAGCSNRPAAEDRNTSLFRIDVIQVPLAAPQNARIVSEPRIFADSAGNIAGLWKGGKHGEGTQTTSETDQCHDITVYSALGLAAGACSGNGILLDIRKPATPRRIAEVSDPNFAYWHSATFSNDGKKVLFTDEWGGGVAPRCRSTDKPEWGADAIFTLDKGKLKPAGYFKLPAPQTAQENCVAHNGSLIPVPGRDIMVQAWYQGGASVFDFTDAAHPKEIAFFDRGPIDTTLVLGGFWSTYWYNGHIYGSEIARGLDVFDLQPSEYLSQNEIDAAKSVHFDFLNVQNQPKIEWPAIFSVARAYLDQLKRNDGIAGERSDAIAKTLDRAERMSVAGRRATLSRLATQLRREAATAGDPSRVRSLASSLDALARSQR